MKKLFLILISILMVLSLSACGESNNNGGSTNVKKTIIEDTTLNKLTFTVPESTKEVTRFVVQKTDGTIVEKDISYKLESEDLISIGYMPNQVLSELMDLSNFDSYEANTQTVYLYGSDTDKYAFIQIDKDLYAVEAQGNNAETLVKNTVDTLGFDGNGELILNDSDLYDITYELPEADKNISNSISVTEDSEGNVVSKYIVFVFGEGEDVWRGPLRVKLVQPHQIHAEFRQAAGHLVRIRMFGETGGGIEQGAPEACLRPVLEDQLPALGLKEAVASSRRLVGKQE